jgi:hypothetical protein
MPRAPATFLESPRGHPLKRHAVVRCPRRRTADGASMENITPPGTPAKRALAVLDNPLPETAGPQLAAA